MKYFLGAAFAIFGLAGCMGYTIGPAKPYYLSDIHSDLHPHF